MKCLLTKNSEEEHLSSLVWGTKPVRVFFITFHIISSFTRELDKELSSQRCMGSYLATEFITLKYGFPFWVGVYQKVYVRGIRMSLLELPFSLKVCFLYNICWSYFSLSSTTPKSSPTLLHVHHLLSFTIL